MAEIDNFETLTRGETTLSRHNVLKAFASTLSRETRPGDIIGLTEQAQFALILPETGRDAEALALRTGGQEEWRRMISVGLACFPQDASDAQGLIKTAQATVKAGRAVGGETLLHPR